MVPVNDFWTLCMIRDKRYGSQELEIKYVLTCLAPLKERGRTVLKMQVTNPPSNYKRCEVRSIPEREKKAGSSRSELRGYRMLA